MNRAREALTSTLEHTEQELDNNNLESNLNCVQDMREAGHRPGDPGEQRDPLPQPVEHGHDVGNGAVACAPGGLDEPAGEDVLAGELARPAGKSREQKMIGKKLSKLTSLTGEQSQLTRTLSLGEQESGMTVEVDRKESSQQMVEATRSLSGTGDVTGKVAREVERLNMLVDGEQEDAGRETKSVRVVRVAGRGRSKAKRKEGEMECSRIDDMIARMGGRRKRKLEMGEDQITLKRRMTGE